jgi:hypothetical protein
LPAAYLTPQEATTRLSAYGLTATPTAAVVLLASDDLDHKGPFIGNPLAEDQHRAFPRDLTVQDDTPSQVPARILDWVALRAYQLSRAHEPGVKAEKVDALSATYTRAKRSRPDRLMKNLLKLYRHAASIRIS